jgi:deoxycytidylate deaminase
MGGPAVALGSAAVVTGGGFIVGGAMLVQQSLGNIFNGNAGSSNSSSPGSTYTKSNKTLFGPGSGRIAYNSDELSHAAFTARQEAGFFGADHNVAVAKLDSGELITGFSKVSDSKGVHSEDDIMNQLKERKISPSRIVELYTERQPCGKCEPMLVNSLKTGTKMTWTVPYGANREINRASHRLLAGYIATAMGR